MTEKDDEDETSREIPFVISKEGNIKRFQNEDWNFKDFKNVSKTENMIMYPPTFVIASNPSIIA